MNHFGERLQQARRMRRLSQRDLAAAVGVSFQAISKYETGQDMPGSAILLRLAQALAVKPDFFFRTQVVNIQVAPSYRKKASLGVKECDHLLEYAREWMERYLEVEEIAATHQQIPPVNADLPTYDVATIDEVENAANELRERWDIGHDAIENLTELLEDKGIKVGVFEGPEGFDAMTLIANNSPVIVGNAAVPGDRLRFTFAHELGHRVLHPVKEMDIEATFHRFAGAFLVPEKMARYELGSVRIRLNFEELLLLKRKYRMSMAAWIYRAKDLHILSEHGARRMFQDLSRYGYRKIEPGEISTELPTRMERLVYMALAEQLISRTKAAELLRKSPLQMFTSEQDNDGTSAMLYH